VTAERHFPFVQFDVPGRLGPDDGRYLLRDPDERPETVVVVQTLGVPTPTKGRLRRQRPRRTEPGSGPPEVPLTRLTVIPAEPLESGAAASAFRGAASDPEEADRLVDDALAAANALLRTHQIASRDPHGHELSREAAVVTRVGHGTGEELADGHWKEAVEVAQNEERRRRMQALRPQERTAQVLAGRESIDACETLLLRARADLDANRTREAALQLRAGLDALLAELPGRAGPEQEDDLTALAARRDPVNGAAAAALRGDPSPEEAAALAETLAICERVLRRRQILSG
jgi:hypothetical protein